MTEQKAIDELNSCHAFGLSSECRSLAKLALEKQIPKKPIYQGESDRCPNCGVCYVFGNCCIECGQRIDWE